MCPSVSVLLRKPNLIENTDFGVMLGSALICWRVNDYAILCGPKMGGYRNPEWDGTLRNFSVINKKVSV